MLGMVNFGINASNEILLPDYALAMKLDWDRVEEGNFTPSARNVFIYSGGSSCIKLKSQKGSRIPIAELEDHGVQLVTLHL